MSNPEFDWEKSLQALSDGYKDKPQNIAVQMRSHAALIGAYIQELEEILAEAAAAEQNQAHNKQQEDQNIGKSEIVSGLYTIRNIANLAFQCPDSYIEVYILQDIVKHISEMTQSLIEEIDV